MLGGWGSRAGKGRVAGTKAVEQTNVAARRPHDEMDTSQKGGVHVSMGHRSCGRRCAGMQRAHGETMQRFRCTGSIPSRYCTDAMACDTHRVTHPPCRPGRLEGTHFIAFLDACCPESIQGSAAKSVEQTNVFLTIHHSPAHHIHAHMHTHPEKHRVTKMTISLLLDKPHKHTTQHTHSHVHIHSHMVAQMRTHMYAFTLTTTCTHIPHCLCLVQWIAGDHLLKLDETDPMQPTAVTNGGPQNDTTQTDGMILA